MAFMTTKRACTEEKIEHIKKRIKREPEQPYPKLSIQPDQPTLCAKQPKGFKSTRSPEVAVSINDLPNEVIHQILNYLKPPADLCIYNYAFFFSALKVCHQWRRIGFAVVYGRGTRDWSPKKWAMMYKVLKHHEARVMKIQAETRPWDLLATKGTVTCKTGGIGKPNKRSA